MINEYLTDLERIKLTKLSYEELSVGQEIVIGEKYLGKCVKEIYQKDGLRAFIILNDSEVMMLFKGSYGIIKGTPTTWRDEWLNTNLPVLLALVSKKTQIPSQLKSAAQVLNQTMKEYPDQQFFLYGHSLGAINLQYALANCHFTRQLGAAYLYEGTNIWSLLNKQERHRVGRIRQRIFNYVDIYDPVTLGITATHQMVGKLCYIDSPQLTPIKQHLWGGYQFDEHGQVKLKAVDEQFLRVSKEERNLVEQANSWLKLFEKRTPNTEWKTFLSTSLARFTSTNKNSSWVELLNASPKDSFLIKDKIKSNLEH